MDVVSLVLLQILKLLSGGQDGTVRVWNLDASDDKSTGLYLLSGFKVWLGSLWSDGERLISDGSDNAIKILNFGEGDNKLEEL